jgi:coxsackievirus/adenovirus receptor
MYIEKSYDWGQTWKVTRYFAAECEKSFPGIFEGSPRYLNETVCQSRYSKIVPSTLGTVIYRVLPPNINIHSPGFNPYSKEVQVSILSISISSEKFSEILILDLFFNFHNCKSN